MQPAEGPSRPRRGLWSQKGPSVCEHHRSGQWGQAFMPLPAWTQHFMDRPGKAVVMSKEGRAPLHSGAPGGLDTWRSQASLPAWAHPSSSPTSPSQPPARETLPCESGLS